MSVNERLFEDMSELFELDETDMDYCDGPLSGWAKRRSDGAWFVFDCRVIIVAKLWHWTLVPTEGRSTTTVEEAFSTAARTETGAWLSVIEDRRAGGAARCHLVVIRNSAARPVLRV